ncbi:MAG: hypothetical protein ACREB0_05900, partial [Sphingopyxis sp.]
SWSISSKIRDMGCRIWRDLRALVQIEPRSLAADYGKLAMDAQYVTTDADERNLRLGEPLDGRMTSGGGDANRVPACGHHGRHQRRYGDQGIVDLDFSGGHRLLQPRCIEIDWLGHNFSFPKTRRVSVR